MSTRYFESVEVFGKKYPVIDHVVRTLETTGDSIRLPVVDIPMMSDYKWQLNGLKSRLEHPEYYEPIEDVKQTIENLRCWLRENKHLATPQEQQLAHDLLVA